MPRASIKLSDLELALEFVSTGAEAECEAYLEIQTGTIYWKSVLADIEEPLPDDIEDGENYLSIPHKKALGLGKPLVLKFCREYLPNDLEEVVAIFGRRGAYTRFKQLLERNNYLAQWYNFEAEAQATALRQWCEDNEITIEA